MTCLLRTDERIPLNPKPLGRRKERVLCRFSNRQILSYEFKNQFEKNRIRSRPFHELHEIILLH
jgi:hypothetical protein